MLFLIILSRIKNKSQVCATVRNSRRIREFPNVHFKVTKTTELFLHLVDRINVLRNTIIHVVPTATV